MAFRHGSNAAIIINSATLSNYVDSMDLTWDTDTAETTVFGATAKTFIAGLPGGKMTLSVVWDPTTSTGPAAVLSALVGHAPVACVAYPGGTAAGQYSRSFSAIMTSYKESSPVGGRVSATAEFLHTTVTTFTAL